KRAFYRLCPLPAMLAFGAVVYAIINTLNHREVPESGLEFALWMSSYILGCLLAAAGVFMGIRLQIQAERRGETTYCLCWAIVLAGSPFLLVAADLLSRLAR